MTCYRVYEYTAGTLGPALSASDNQYADTDWGDQITDYCGYGFTFDGAGNILTVGSSEYTWEHGRQLKSLAGWTYTYDANGMRTGRTKSYNTYTYVYNGSKLSRMTYNNTVLDFTYDAAGTPLTVEYNGTVYYYVTNLQGDVVGILDGSGNSVVQYSYNAWGYPLGTNGSLAASLGTVNPLRYRGYVFDADIGLYYLESRYYNPGLCRFQSADAFASTGQGLLGNNMYIYCNNNPVNRVDYYGYMSRFNQISTYDSIKPIGCYAYEMYEKVRDSYSAAGIKLYSTEWGALMDWRNTYLPLSTEYEHAAYLYSVETTLGTRFYFSNTYRGSKGGGIMSANVVIPTLILEVSRYFAGGNLVAQVHTHPMAPNGFHNDFPSYSSDIYGGDRLAYELFGYSEMYVIPYTRCLYTPMIIAISDRSTWCEKHPYH